VVNRDDINTYSKSHQPIRTSFGLSQPQEKEFGLINRDNTTYLAYGNELLLDVAELPLQGRHNWSNALAALAIGHCLGLTFGPMLEVLRTFHGLAHRCQMVIKKNNITWYNDSKGTNVGATLAAIAGLQLPQQRHLILIAGGIGKGADFSPLSNIVQESVKLLILFGQDKAIIQNALAGSTDIVDVADLQEAIALADERASSGDVILFSPACASYDMFNNYEHRGELYCQWVLERLS
jgi:UDP-N-acetylmuramoylalanine--D-glutamate ligase